jgi:hypothetical protein
VGSKEKDATIENFQTALIDSAQARSAQLEAERMPAQAVVLPRPADTGATSTAWSAAPADTDAEPQPQPRPGTTVTVRNRDFVAELVALSA